MFRPVHIRVALGVWLVVFLTAFADSRQPNLPFHSSLMELERALPGLKPTRLDLRITGSAEVVRPKPEARTLGQQAILGFPVRIENRSKLTITANIANEWYGGEWPTTDLYASLRKKEDKGDRLISHEIYVVGETGKTEAFVWKPGESHEVILRLNWPGTGSQHGGAFVRDSSPGTYLLRIFLIFRSPPPNMYGFEYAGSPEMEIKIEQ